MVHVVIVLVVVGFLLWIVNSSKIPMDGTIKQILTAVVILAVVLWLLTYFGLLDDGSWTSYRRGHG